ncbi:MAG: tetratricopeptide repeat protein [Kordia sp.]|uniref:tetratricopeptide repeat protein n=1 Tax=Kordia sp. TaxID=1965332 RepID=UPI003859B6D6
MKKVVLILSFVFFGSITTGTAQTKYEKGMEKAFSLWKENKSTEAVNVFERISAATPNEWLPSYYAAQINIINGFAIKDKSKLTQQLEKAQAQIDHATSISPNNPEIMILQAMLYTVWVAYDGATYGMQYAPKVSQIYAKALAINNDNPRVVLNKAEWDIGSARYFGQDTSPFCKELQRAKTLFEAETKKDDFSPSWGKDRATKLAEECSK